MPEYLLPVMPMYLGNFIHYIENWSFLLDLKIILRTVPVMLFGLGGY